MLRTIVEVHIIQTVPPSNMNRDDTGSPKTAMYGGRRRARVSSQAWKRATRNTFSDLLEPSELGVRTKRVVELLTERIVEQDPTLGDRAEELAKAVLTAAGIKLKKPRKEGPDESGYLLFLSDAQVSALAELAVSAARASDGAVSIDKKDAKARADQRNSVDVALFGRMVADDTDLNVDAAVQVAHALSVHEVSTEFDYYTAVDDHKRDDPEEDAGAGMIGTVEFNSSTMYRYATVDVDRLRDNLGDDEATRRAVEAFVRAFVTSMPTGKQNTFANRTLPDAVLLVVRKTQPVNFVGAFEEAIPDRANGGRIGTAARRLVAYGRDVHETYDERPVAAFSVAVGERGAALAELGDRVSFDTAVGSIGDLVGRRLVGSA
ncbi:CRISPR system Cascade subunit CasC [Amycolatopsis arida]|uniref:CRISPR system Cascade subunit CasC n=1 Tax=Amycolatopsis arida TaxID=587909 RepID=A0A1I5R1I7_9PSEU|nr:type I-E CRISPR-associated protein Cas7/Cse4/CasC [Amycolatopsis arida]TDX99040.1 CRISPR system Cascade subunit CasC [Amycolatopsis arida]SFP52345.1 CRISPR system Cascade subunit CasC [Amycolatopsis arida]